VHRLLIAAPQHCAGHAATEAAQIRGLFGACSTQRAGDAAFSSLSSFVFFSVEYFWRSTVYCSGQEKLSLHFFFSKERNKTGNLVVAGLGDPRLGYFYLKDLSCVPRETTGFEGSRVTT
jgi:hypothetical protein